MPKRGFIRVLWGIGHRDDPFFRAGDPSHEAMLVRGRRLWVDVNLSRHNMFHPPFVAYVFGRHSYERLRALGYDCRLADERPLVWGEARRGEDYTHKLEAFLLASREFDEFVFLDWDVVPVSPIPCGFWDVLGRKSAIQAPLLKYGIRFARWRPVEEEKRFLPSAAFVYMRDMSLPKRLVELWDAMGQPPKEEMVIGALIDQMTGGWVGHERYREMFQPDFFRSGSLFFSAYGKSESKAGCEIFEHMGKGYVNREILRCTDPKSLPAWWKGDCLDSQLEVKQSCPTA